MTSASPRRPVVNRVLLVVLCLFLGTTTFWFLAAAACFDEEYRQGGWNDLGAAVALFTLFPALGLCCFILAGALLRRGAYRRFALSALVAAVVMGCPFIGTPLAEGISRPAAFLLGHLRDFGEKGTVERPVMRPGRAEARNEAKKSVPPEPVAVPPNPVAEPIRRQFNSLKAQFNQPQRILRADRGLVLLVSQERLSLYGVNYSRANTADLTKYVNESLVGQLVTIRLPDLVEFAKAYTPGPYSPPPPVAIREENGVDARGFRYGTIPCLVYVDGALLNARYAGTAGSFHDFQAYETTPHTPGR